MNFVKVFNFIKKRFEETQKLNNEDFDEMVRLFNKLRVKYPSIERISSGLLLDGEYLRYGLDTEHKMKVIRFDHDKSC